MLQPPEKPIFKSKSAHKAAVFGMIIISLAILYWGFESIYSSIKLSPDSPKIGWDNYQKQQAAQQLAQLKSQDTDNDGLSDFDEQYIYNTSIYLDDTDSDGFTDQEEINQGTDPLCPAGQNCQGNVSVSSTPSAILQSQTDPSAIRAFLLNSGIDSTQLNALSDEEVVAIYQNTLNSLDSSSSAAPTASELRQELASAGLDSSILENVDDATLLKMYEESLSEQSQISSASSSDNSVLQDLNADEIRSLLKQAGMSDSDLEGIDDDTLKKIFLENLSSE